MAKITLSGGDRLEQRLASIAQRVAKGATLRVGFLEGATYPDGTPVAMIAAIQNFGAPAKGIPPRPFFTKFINDNSDKWGGALSRILSTVDYDIEEALNRMGMGMSAQLQTALIETNSPPLSKVTLLLRERFSDHGNIEFSDVLQAWQDVADGVEPTISGTGAKPLVWTGTMLNAIDYEVTVKDGW